jgi:ketosteroid isomerase-like protein
MKNHIVQGLASALLVVASGAALAQSAPAPATRMTAAECDVWARERSFAQSVEAHDATAFAEHLHPGAIFIGGPEPARGKAAVVTDWAPLVKGEIKHLHWAPDQVVIGGDPDVALSMGPYWMEDTRPGANPRFHSGRFISTWRRDAQGTWHVLYDGGGGNRAEPASEDDVARLKASLPATCPSA